MSVIATEDGSYLHELYAYPEDDPNQEYRPDLPQPIDIFKHVAKCGLGCKTKHPLADCPVFSGDRSDEATLKGLKAKCPGGIHTGKNDWGFKTYFAAAGVVAFAEKDGKQYMFFINEVRDGGQGWMIPGGKREFLKGSRVEAFHETAAREFDEECSLYFKLEKEETPNEIKENAKKFIAEVKHLLYTGKGINFHYGPGKYMCSFLKVDDKWLDVFPNTELTAWKTKNEILDKGSNLYPFARQMLSSQHLNWKLAFGGDE